MGRSRVQQLFTSILIALPIVGFSILYTEWTLHPHGRNSDSPHHVDVNPFKATIGISTVRDIDRPDQVDILFYGDDRSIDNWHYAGGKVWAENFVPLKAEIVRESPVAGKVCIFNDFKSYKITDFKPKLVVMIFPFMYSPADSITAIAKAITNDDSHPKVLLLGIFPHDRVDSINADKEKLARIEKYNAILAKLDDGGKTVRYIDINDQFFDGNGHFSNGVSTSGLEENGYRICAAAILPIVKEMLKK